MAEKRSRMKFRDAMDLVPDDLPDGAFFAMAHEIAGMEYGEGFDELAAEAEAIDWSKYDAAPTKCPECGRTLKGHAGYLQHYRVKHDKPRKAREASRG